MFNSKSILKAGCMFAAGFAAAVVAVFVKGKIDDRAALTAEDDDDDFWEEMTETDFFDGNEEDETPSNDAEDKDKDE